MLTCKFGLLLSQFCSTMFSPSKVSICQEMVLVYLSVWHCSSTSSLLVPLAFNPCTSSFHLSIKPNQYMPKSVLASSFLQFFGRLWEFLSFWQQSFSFYLFLLQLLHFPCNFLVLTGLEFPFLALKFLAIPIYFEFNPFKLVQSISLCPILFHVLHFPHPIYFYWFHKFNRSSALHQLVPDNPLCAV